MYTIWIKYTLLERRWLWTRGNYSTNYNGKATDNRRRKSGTNNNPLPKLYQVAYKSWLQRSVFLTYHLTTVIQVITVTLSTQHFQRSNQERKLSLHIRKHQVLQVLLYQLSSHTTTWLPQRYHRELWRGQ